MTKKKWSIVFGVVFLMFVIVLVGVGIGMNLEEGSKYPDRGLPVIEISLNGVSLEEIDGGSKDIKYEGNKLNIYNNSEVMQYDGVEVKGRGNATWTWDKKPYQIKFTDKVDLLGMGKSRKWYLMANYGDETNLRTAIGFTLENMLDMEYAMDGRFVELYVDEDYRGLYYLTQAVEVSKNGVDLRDPNGVLVELDNIYGEYEKNYRTGEGEILTLKDAVNRDSEVGMMDFLKSYNELEQVVKEGDYKRMEELIDVESFAKYFLLSEFTVNPDAYWTSFYMYKDGVNNKIHAGPGWDFDMALANRNWWCWLGDRLYSPTEMMVRKLELSLDTWVDMGNDEGEFVPNDLLSRIVFDMMDMPEFQGEVRRIFRDRLAGRGRELLMKIKNEAMMIHEVALVDSEKWVRDRDFTTEVETLIEWVKARYEYFEQLYGDKDGDKIELML